MGSLVAAEYTTKKITDPTCLMQCAQDCTYISDRLAPRSDPGRTRLLGPMPSMSAKGPKADVSKQAGNVADVPGAVLGAIVPGNNNCQRRVSGSRYPREPQTGKVDRRARFRDRSPVS